MAFEHSTLSKDSQRSKHGLIFDTDSVTLGGRYSNEFDAYRARKSWMEILNRYFLLENERDYEMKICGEAGEVRALSCCFVSACGRYAFWRLINHQAPEAEQKLAGNADEQTIAAGILASILGAPNDRTSSDFETTILGEPGSRQRKPTLIGGILNQFRKLM